jgi:hypothetical protein
MEAEDPATLDMGERENVPRDGSVPYYPVSCGKFPAISDLQRDAAVDVSGH